MGKDKTDCEGMPERIWLSPEGAHLPYQPTMHWEWQEYRRADLCASGQQVRALEWEDWSARHRTNVTALTLFGRYNIIQLHFPEMHYKIEPPHGKPFSASSLTEAKAAAQADYERRILAALTPAPLAATPTAQGAEPVAWQVRYHSRWVMAPSCWTDEDRANWPGEHRALYTHPPQPSVTVAEAVDLLLSDDAKPSMERAVKLVGVDWGSFRATLRALKGDA